MTKTVVLSSKSQITLPQSFLRELGIAKYSKINLSLEEGGLMIRPFSATVVGKTAGSLTSFIPKSKLGVSTKEALESISHSLAKSLAGQI